MKITVIIQLVLIIAALIYMFARIPAKQWIKDHEWVEFIMTFVMIAGLGNMAFALEAIHRMNVSISGICEAVKLICVTAFIATGAIVHIIDRDRSREFFEKHMVLQSIVSIIVFIGFGGLLQIIFSR